MDDFRRVEVFHSLGELVHDVPVVQIFEYLLADGVVEVGFHEFEDEVKILVVLGPDHVIQLYYVGVVQLVEIANLSVGPLGVD